MVGLGSVRRDKAWRSWCGRVGPVAAWRSRRGRVRRDLVGCGEAVKAGRGEARQGEAGPGETMPGRSD